jgi:Bacterial Ig-like domain (group 3)/Chitobiase/beta-hexosaminidase C-terminal domain/Beta-propeller repeat
LHTHPPTSLIRSISGILSLLIIVFGLTSQPLAAAQGVLPEPNPDRAQIARNIGALPMSFESNRGQSDMEARFLHRGPGYSILFKDREVDLLLKKTYPESDAPDRRKKRSAGGQPSAFPLIDSVRMRLAGARPGLAAVGEDRLPGTVNYFVGNDPAKWHAGIPTFERVRYTNAYPGVDLVYYGNQQRLEFDFEVADGAGASAIMIQFSGAKNLKLDRNGNLVIAAANGSVRFRKPAIYQRDGRGNKIPIEGSFRVVSGRTVGFRLGHFDHTKPLVIDPILDYSTHLGGGGGANAIAVDSTGNAYVAGWALLGMPTTGGIQPTPPAKANSLYTSAYVAKFNSTGTALIYCTYLSGSQNDAANGITVDANGNAYVAGTTSSTDFPTTSGAFQTTNKSKNEAGFVAKINPTGTTLAYSTYLSGSIGTQIAGIAVDASGNAHVTGTTSDSDFPVTAGAFQSANKATADNTPTGFVTELNGTGAGLLYSTYLGGSIEDNSAAIALDSGGDAFVTGSTESADFPTTPGAFQSTNKGTSVSGAPSSNTFVTKMNPAGTGLVYSTYLGGSVSDIAFAIGIDGTGNAYTTGLTASADFPTTPGSFKPTLDPDSQNAYVTKLNASGTALAYSTFLGGGPFGFDQGSGIAVDSAGNATVVGSTGDLNFPITAGALQSQNTSMIVTGGALGTTLSSFVTRLNSTGSALLYSTYLSGSGIDGSDFDPLSYCDCANGVALDASSNVYLAGHSWSTDFPTTLDAFQASYSGTFVTEFNASEMKTLPATTITLTSNVNPQVPGEPVVFTATVNPTSGITPTGTVGFSVSTGGFPWDLSPWSTVSMNSSGVATFTTSTLLPGQSTINAYYLGDQNNAPSSGTTTETISLIPTVTTLVASATTAPYGSPTTFTATVIENTGKPASGFVFFGVGNLVYATLDLDTAGQVTWTNGVDGPLLPVGVETVTAEFIGYSKDKDSTGSVVETVTPLGVTSAPTFSPGAGTYTTPQEVFLNGQGTIYYTTDGTTPVVGTSSIYGDGYEIEVESSVTIKAIAIVPGYTESPVATANYVINLPAADFSVLLNPASLTIMAGAGATTEVVISPIGGFSQQVSLTCSGLPAGTTVSFSPSTIVPNTPSVLTMNVASTATSNHRPGIGYIPLTSLALGFVWFGLRKRPREWSWMFIVGGTLALFSLGACGGGSGQPKPVTSTVTITGTSGSLSHSTTLTLTVN